MDEQVALLNDDAQRIMFWKCIASIATSEACLIQLRRSATVHTSAATAVVAADNTTTPVTDSMASVTATAPQPVFKVPAPRPAFAATSWPAHVIVPRPMFTPPPQPPQLLFATSIPERSVSAPRPVVMDTTTNPNDAKRRRVIIPMDVDSVWQKRQPLYKIFGGESAGSEQKAELCNSIPNW
jgi:hypothetical protein